ncbi:Craniofacial development protein 2 [Mytilus edulis]|uniref:Craniofacial development protein 2 n=1 Tax=Mytilus edulis TaxID=6550 RepID=A0A8S3RMU1_MYTED|nr:Craniofacial development protein 2 [Mytilus edulis]
MNAHLPNFSQSGISAIQTPSRNNLSHGRTLETLDEASHSAYGLRYSMQDIDTMSDSIATRDDDGAMIQVYAPTNGADDCEKEDFYHSLQTTIEKVPKRDLLVLMGDLNAKVGSERKGWDREIGPHGIGKMNENGELFADFCATNNLVIGGTLFKHKNCHKVTWVSPAGNAENQIDHITISQRWRSSLQDVRVKRGADAASDHHLVIGSIKMKLLAQKNQLSKEESSTLGS